jgi:hypothetical protein
MSFSTAALLIIGALLTVLILSFLLNRKGD